MPIRALDQAPPEGLEHVSTLPQNGHISKQATQNPTQIDPDLARIVAAWRSLPEPIRRAMLALIA